MEIIKLNNRNKQLLLFDFDGVLVDSEDFYCDFWYKSLLNYNFRFESSDLLGTSNRDFLNKLPPSHLGRPILNASLTFKQWSILEKINRTLNDDFKLS